MNKEKEIEEVRDIIARIVVGHEKEVWGIEAAARQIIARAGYGKEDEVRKETICRMIDIVIDAAKQRGFSHSDLSQIIGALVDGKFVLYAEYGLETDE